MTHEFKALPPLTSAGTAALFADAFSLISADVDFARLAEVVLTSQATGLSFTAALVAVQANLSGIIRVPALVPVGEFLLGLLHKTNQAA